MFFGKQDPAMLQRVEEARCVRLGGLEEGCISVAGCFVKERTPHLLFIGISRLQVAITIASRFFITHRMMQIGQEAETGLLCTIASEEEAGRPAILVDEGDTRTPSRFAARSRKSTSSHQCHFMLVNETCKNYIYSSNLLTSVVRVQRCTWETRSLVPFRPQAGLALGQMQKGGGSRKREKPRPPMATIKGRILRLAPAARREIGPNPSRNRPSQLRAM